MPGAAIVYPAHSWPVPFTRYEHLTHVLIGTVSRKKKRPSLLRRIFGGSDRPHHLACNFWAAMLFLPVILVTPWAALSLMACLAHEGWASPDRDIEERKANPYWYWLPYGRMVSHRHWASHGLIIGTVIRFLYGWWFILFLWPVNAAMVVAWFTGCLVSDIAHWALDR